MSDTQVLIRNKNGYTYYFARASNQALIKEAELKVIERKNSRMFWGKHLTRT